MIRWIVFDADDTLMDFQSAQENAFYAALEIFGLEKKEEYLHNYKWHSEKLWKALEQGKLTKPELLEQRFILFCRDFGLLEIHRELNETYIQELSKRGELLPGAEEILKKLWKIYPMALATNGVSRIQKGRLEANGIGKYFQHILISEDTGFEKPQKGFFDALMKKIGSVSPEEVLFIGDSLTSDMEGALNYGMIACWYNPLNKSTTLQVHKEINSLEEIPKILKELTL